MIKIAIAGTNGLAQFVAYYLSQLTSHDFVFLTRTVQSCTHPRLFFANLAQPNPGLKERDWQVLVINYDDPPALTYALRGVDLVISTINGKSQLALLDAVAAAQVRHFIPSGFSGPEQCAAQNTIKTDWQDLMDRLRFHETNSMLRYTVFACGVFYEHFGPGGLNAAQISTSNNYHASIGEEGDLIVDIRVGRATIPVVPNGEEAAICMTSARDVARYVVAALLAYENLTIWPQEFKFRTERFTMTELVTVCSRVKGESLSAPGLRASLSSSICLSENHTVKTVPLLSISLCIVRVVPSSGLGPDQQLI